MLYFILLYSLLSHPNFAVRESATAQLLHLVDRHPQTYGPRLSAMLRESAEPEVLARGRRIVAVWDRWRVMNYVPRTVPVFPICDAGLRPGLFGVELRDKHQMDEWFIWAMQKPGDLSAPYWTRYRRATEMMARDAIRRGVPDADVDYLLLRLWKMERRHQSDSPDSMQEEIESWTGWVGIPCPKR